MENRKQCFLILIGAREDGAKELIAVLDGYRESKLRMELLSSLKDRGLAEGPKLAVGDGGLGFWAALREVYPETRNSAAGCIRPQMSLIKCPKAYNPGPRKDPRYLQGRDKRRGPCRFERIHISLRQ